MSFYILATNTGPVRYYREVNGIGRFKERLRDRATRLSEWMAATILHGCEHGPLGTFRALEVRD